MYQDLSRLGALRRPDDLARLEQVHEASRLGEAHAQLALQHRGGAELGGDDELGGREEVFEIVADVLRHHGLGLGLNDVLAELRLGLPLDVLDGCVVRQKKAYPVYDQHYQDYVEAIRSELESRFPTLHVVGRNGMHKYNNQDHSMLTAMMAVWNMQGAQHDIWSVNTDFEYHEEQRLEPAGATSPPPGPPRS